MNKQQIKTLLFRFAKKHWFWITVILIIVFSLLFDLIVLNVWAVKEIFFSNWSGNFQLLTFSFIALDLLHRKDQDPQWLRSLKRLLLIILAFWGWRDYGFIITFILVVSIIIFVRLIRFIFDRILNYKR